MIPIEKILSVHLLLKVHIEELDYSKLECWENTGILFHDSLPFLTQKNLES